MRVSMSAIGSVMVMGGCPFSPWFPEACGEFDVGNGGRCKDPELPGALGHAGEFAAVSHLSQTDAAQSERAENRSGTAAPLATGVPADGELRLAVRLGDECLLGHALSSPGRGWSSTLPESTCPEREAERPKQRTPRLVVIGGGHDGDVHAAHPVDPVLVDLVED